MVEWTINYCCSYCSSHSSYYCNGYNNSHSSSLYSSETDPRHPRGNKVLLKEGYLIHLSKSLD